MTEKSISVKFKPTYAAVKIVIMLFGIFLTIQNFYDDAGDTLETGSSNYSTLSEIPGNKSVEIRELNSSKFIPLSDSLTLKSVIDSSWAKTKWKFEISKSSFDRLNDETKLIDCLTDIYELNPETWPVDVFRRLIHDYIPYGSMDSLEEIAKRLETNVGRTIAIIAECSNEYRHRLKQNGYSW